MMNLNQIKNRLQNRVVSTVDKHRFYSVLIPFVEIDGEIHIVYELRSNNIPRQPGEVCFPGGAIEPGETPVEAAIRETCEEIGVSKKDISVFAEGDTMITPNRFTMYCYFATISKKAYDNISINPDEVGEVFTVPLNWFLENEPEVYMTDLVQTNRDDFPYEKANITSDYPWLKLKTEIPIYSYEDKAIWGLTGRITRNLVRILKGDRE